MRNDTNIFDEDTPISKKALSYPSGFCLLKIAYCADRRDCKVPMRKRRLCNHYEPINEEAECDEP